MIETKKSICGNLFSGLKFKKVLFNYLCALIAITVLLIADQLTKLYLFNSNAIGQLDPLYRWGSFQISSNAVYYASDPVASNALIVLASIIICIYSFYIAWIKKSYNIIATSLVIAGLLSNMIDFGLSAGAPGGMFIRNIFFVAGSNPSLEMFNLAWIWLALGIILQVIFTIYEFLLKPFIGKEKIKTKRIAFSSIEMGNNIIKELNTLDKKYSEAKNKNLL